MSQKFTIAPVASIDRFQLMGEKSKVPEAVFWIAVESKVREITAVHQDKYEETLALVKSPLIEAKMSLTVLDVCFESKGKKP
jgi:hypothetical protein